MINSKLADSDDDGLWLDVATCDPVARITPSGINYSKRVIRTLAGCCSAAGLKLDRHQDTGTGIVVHIS